MKHTGNVPKKMLNGDTDFEFTDFIMQKENPHGCEFVHSCGISSKSSIFTKH